MVAKHFVDVQVRLGDGRIVIVPLESFERDYYKTDQKIRRFKVVTPDLAARRIAAGWIRTEERWSAPMSDAARRERAELAENERWWAEQNRLAELED